MTGDPGSQLQSVNTSVGLFAGSAGFVALQDGLPWTNSGQMDIGVLGNGTLNILHGSLSTAEGCLGLFNSGIGVAVVNGAECGHSVHWSRWIA